MRKRKSLLSLVIITGITLLYSGCVRKTSSEQKEEGVHNKTISSALKSTGEKSKSGGMDGSVDSGNSKDASSDVDVDIDSGLIPDNDAGIEEIFIDRAYLLETVPEEVVQAAEDGFFLFYHNKKDVLVRLLGLDSEYELTQVRLGLPFELFKVPYNSLINDEPGITSYIVPIHAWRFPMISKGKYSSFLEVSLVDGKWKIVSMGGSGDSGKVEKIEKRLNISKSGEKRAIVISFELGVDFVLFADRDEEYHQGNFYLPTNEGYFYDNFYENWTEPLTLKEMVDSLKNEVRKRRGR